MITGIENPLVFLGAGILLNLYPGPDTFYIIGRSLAQGRGAGVCAALGISSGALIHTLEHSEGTDAVFHGAWNPSGTHIVTTSTRPPFAC